MNAIDLLVDSVGRVQENVHTVVNGLGQEQLGHRLDPEANSIAWLVWHLTRVQDDHVAEVAGHEQVWTAQGWVERFALPFGPRATGYGQGSAEIAALGAVSGELLTGYYDAVHASTVEYLRTLTDDDLDRVVDTRWDPPVTLGVRLVSVIDDDAQHAGQASFVRGILERRA
ncbi:mycothiol transferase [Pseudonocardia sp. GCM10023141]|uniref:mycothiol transferase n=1 Tax=Pseudonocardia sp. GCM10023141 TaxID=3252653 RepID=UPI00361E472E